MSTENELSPTARGVQEALRRLGHAHRVVELDQTTRSAREAAEAIGCRVEQIAKSLIFCARDSGRPILVVASGKNRVSEAKLASHVGEAIVRPDADYVRARTGYAIGGVPPIAHAEAIETYIDRDLLGLDTIWAAAGTPRAVFSLTPEELVALTGGRVVDVT